MTNLHRGSTGIEHTFEFTSCRDSCVSHREGISTAHSTVRGMRMSATGYGANI